MNENDRFPDNSACPGCGRTFGCGVKAGEGRCWCMALPAGLPLPASSSAACYCPECLDKLRRQAAAAQQ